MITVRSVLDHHAGIPGTLTKGFITTGRPDPGYPGVVWQNVDLCKIEKLTMKYDRNTDKTTVE